MEQTLTEGSIYKKLIYFAFPIFCGNLFQQLYNTMDSLIVGRTLGNNALAAVSSSGNLIFLMIGFFQGLSIGAGVISAKYYGSKNDERLHKSIHTTIAIGLLSGILLTIVATTLAPKILILMGTPEEVLPSSTTYFRIYFSGSLAFVMYNFLTGILQACGDSKHPLYYLITSSVINVILDLTFIIVFHQGVGSAALATIIAQSFSALLCLYHLTHVKTNYQVFLKDVSIDLSLAKEIIYQGLPTGIQNSIISFSNVIVQSHINSFGSACMAGCGSYAKIEGFVFLPILAIMNANTTFISQNLGAKEYERCKKASKFSMFLAMALAEGIGIIFFIFAPNLISIFGASEEAISFGVKAARTTTLFYFLLSFSHCTAGILRGCGKSIVPMLVMMICWCVIRVSYMTILCMFIHNIRLVYLAYPITWSLSSVVYFIYYKHLDFKKVNP